MSPTDGGTSGTDKATPPPKGPSFLPPTANPTGPAGPASGPAPAPPGTPRPNWQPGPSPFGQPGQPPSHLPGPSPFGQPGQPPTYLPGQPPLGQPGQPPTYLAGQPSPFQAGPQPQGRPPTWPPPQGPGVAFPGAQPPPPLGHPLGATPAAPQGYPPPMSCYRHPGRETLIRCQRCRRPICPDCMTTASVGVHCPECVAAGVRETRADQLPFGGRRVAIPMLTSGVLLAINLAVWLLITMTGGAASPWHDRLALLPVGRCVPVNDPTTYAPDVSATACRAVGGVWQWVPGVADGAIWQLLTSAFTHVGVLHLGSNMLMLMITGPVLERVFGRARFLAVYLLSALGASVAVMWFSNPASSTVGASGALFGLMGALLVLTAKVRANMQNIATIVGINLVASFAIPGVSLEGHLGGFVTGALLGALIVHAPRERRVTWQWAGMAVLGVAMVGLTLFRMALM